MQDAAQFVQLAQTLYYDLARAEKATDGKKKAAKWIKIGFPRYKRQRAEEKRPFCS